MNDRIYDSPYEEKDSHSSLFNIMEWLFRILKYWYIILFCTLLGLAGALIKNRYWMPQYKSSAKILIDEGKSRMFGPENVLQGFGLQSGLRNAENQLIILSSYDLIKKTIEQTDFQTDLYIRGKFRSASLYGAEPIKVTHTFIAKETYFKEMKIKGVNDNEYEISYEGDESNQPFRFRGQYDKPLQNPHFFLTVSRARKFETNFEAFLQFYTQEALIELYSKRLMLNFVTKESTVIEAYLVGYTPAKDVTFLSTFCKVFLHDNVEKKNEAALKTISFIETQLGIISDSLSFAENRLRGYQKENNLQSTDNNTAAFDYFRTLDKEKAALLLKGQYLNYLQSYMASNMEDGQVVAPSSLGITDPSLLTLVNNYSALLLKKQEIGEKNPLYPKLEAQIEATRKALRDLLYNMQKIYNIEEKNINERYDLALSKIKGIPDMEKNMLKFQRDFKVNDTYYTYLLQKRAESQIQQASNVPDNVIVEEARSMGPVNTKDKITSYILFLFLGFVLPICGIIIKELLNTSVQSIAEIEALTHHPVIGNIPWFEKEGVILASRYPKSAFTESLRSVRDRIEFLAKKKSPLVLTITSTEPSDGKTFLSCNMASIYQMTGKRVILVDMDLRKPAVEKSLDLTAKLGVSNILVGQARWEDAIIRSNAKYKFDILCAGTIPPNPGELVRLPALKGLIEGLRKEYDYVIIDSSPFGLVSDIVAISEYADVNLFTIRANKTDKRFLAFTLEQATKDNIKNSGILFNGVTQSNGSYYGKSGYGYGYIPSGRSKGKGYTSHYYQDDFDTLEQEK